MNKTKYFPIIGLEIHVELKTKSKMFCQCNADYFQLPPNSNTCPVCLGMPGALPVPNEQAILYTIKIAQALNCQINTTTRFDRKHYFYPDLPKGYQISQYEEPIGIKGYVEIDFKSNTGTLTKKFDITRVHLEEDTGKLTHKDGVTLVDFNRSSVPLVEIVTEPCFQNSEEVKTFLEELHAIIRTLEVSDADMEKGTMRLEPNISLSGISDYSERIVKLPNYKVEVKNINSFNFAKKAVDFEIQRQSEILDSEKTPAQETRGYNEEKGVTYSQRSKENAQDYRYFPDPDIPPIFFDKEALEQIKNSIEELPNAKKMRYMMKFALKFEDAFLISRSKSLSSFFEKVVADINNHSTIDLPLNVKENLAVTVANCIVNKKITETKDSAKFILAFEKLYKPKNIDKKSLLNSVKETLENNPAQVKQYKSGKTTIIGFFIGQVMKKESGNADPSLIKELIEKELNSS